MGRVGIFLSRGESDPIVGMSKIIGIHVMIWGWSYMCGAQLLWVGRDALKCDSTLQIV